MYPKLKVAVSAIFILTTAYVAAAKDDVPVIDLQKRCKASVIAMRDISYAGFSEEDAFKTCLNSERHARDAIVTAWKTMPASYKTRCIDPSVYSPSYIEWISCLELYLDVKQQRSQRTQQMIPPSTRRCPIIDYAEDGSIKTVNACPSVTSYRQN
jgi:hypothetical protein